MSFRRRRFAYVSLPLWEKLVLVFTVFFIIATMVLGVGEEIRQVGSTVFLTFEDVFMGSMSLLRPDPSNPRPLRSFRASGSGAAALGRVRRTLSMPPAAGADSALLIARKSS